MSASIFIFAAGGPYLVDSNTVVMIALILFLALVYWKGWPLVRGMLDARIEEIKSELDEAKNLRQEAETLLAEYQAKHKKAVAEAKAIVKAAESDAKALRDKAEANLKAALKRRETAAKARIAQSQATAIAKAQAEAATQAIAAAEKMLTDKMDADTDGALISEAIALVPGRLH